MTTRTRPTNSLVRLHTNSQDFRVARGQGDFSLEKNAWKYRALLLGPSFAFGWAANFEDSFAAQLEKRIEQAGFAGQRDVEIINAGVTRTGRHWATVWLRRR